MRKIGIFGGSFNPPHNGHVNSIVTVQKKMGFDLIHIVPNNQNPLKIPMETPSAEFRIEMCRKAFDTYGKAFYIDDIELKRGGVSYTIDTVKELLTDESRLLTGAQAQPVKLRRYINWRKSFRSGWSF